MTNQEIIFEEAKRYYDMEELERLLESGDLGLHTYKDWQSMGMQVKKGEKAIIKTKLWRKCTKKEKDENGEEVKTRQFYLVTAFLFGRHQVEPIQEKKAN